MTLGWRGNARSSTVPEKFALLVGSYEYAQEPGLQRLQGPQNDIAALKAVLGDPEIGGFGVQTSINESSGRVLELVEEFLAERTREDVVLLYFSGHGIKENGELYFAMANTRRTRLLSSALKARTVHDALRGCRARQQLLVLDCCHSGAVQSGMVIRSGTSVCTQDFFDGRGHVVLTASDSIQYALEEGPSVTPDERPHSIFTRALVEGLTTGDADRDGDGLITVDELYDYLHTEVRTRTPEQTPCKWAMDQQGKLVIARVPVAKRKPAALPPELHEAIHDRLPWIRQGAVAELARLLQSDHPGHALAARQSLESLVEDDSRSVGNSACQALGWVPTPVSRPAIVRPVLSVFRDRLEDGGEGPPMVVIPAGSFLMGSPDTAGGRSHDEGPQRRVAIKAFALGQFAITFDDYDHFCRSTKSRGVW